MNINNLQFIYTREQIMQAIRDFFGKEGFHEIITPVLNQSIPLEPNIYPFVTEWKTIKGKEMFYLSTSPEKNLKKMLSLGINKCFSIGHSFRNLEASGPLHSPEFLMLEWYRKNTDYKVIMNDVKNVIIFIQKKMKSTHMYNRLNDWASYSLVTLFKLHAKLDLKEAIISDRKLFEYAKNKGYQTTHATWNELYDQIFVNEIEPNLPRTPCFLFDFPARISTLCRLKKTEPYLAERFELYINRVELANGNTENTDYKSVEKVFKDEQKRRKRQGLSYPNLDQEFLDALKKMAQNQYAGIGLGIDRLTMILK